MKTKQSFVMVSASLAAGMAQGSVIYSGPLNLQQANESRLAVDMNGDLMPDFTFGYEFDNKPYIDARTSVSTEIPAQSGDVTLLTKENRGLPLTGAGTSIGVSYANSYPGTGDPRGYFNLNDGGDVVVGDWSNSAVNEGYVGIIFKPDDQTHYGWLNFIDDPIQKTLTLKGWAYESTSGLALETAVVPEPGTSVLTGLGLASLLALRRRQQGK